MNVEMCNECGKSVAFGSGRFVDRVMDFNDLETRRDMGKQFPEGDFICPQCEYEETQDGTSRKDSASQAGA